MSDLTSAIQVAGAQERTRAIHEETMHGTPWRVAGTVEVINAGEALVDIAFPVWFYERPSVSFGAELGANEKLEPGEYPTVSAVVYRWRRLQRDLHEFYVGATLVVVTSGHTSRQRMTVHWQAEGGAIPNPALRDTAAEERV